MDLPRDRLWPLRATCDWALSTMQEAHGFPPDHPVRREVLALRRRLDTAIVAEWGTPSIRGFQRSLACTNMPRRAETL